MKKKKRSEEAVTPSFLLRMGPGSFGWEAAGRVTSAKLTPIYIMLKKKNVRLNSEKYIQKKNKPGVISLKMNCNENRKMSFLME